LFKECTARFVFAIYRSRKGGGGLEDRGLEEERREREAYFLYR
jgi:hypothetical protein